MKKFFQRSFLIFSILLGTLFVQVGHVRAFDSDSSDVSDSFDSNDYSSDDSDDISSDDYSVDNSLDDVTDTIDASDYSPIGEEESEVESSLDSIDTIDASDYTPIGEEKSDVKSSLDSIDTIDASDYSPIGEEESEVESSLDSIDNIKEFSRDFNRVAAPFNSFSTTTAGMYGNYRVEDKDVIKPQKTWISDFTGNLKEGFLKADAKKISDAFETIGEVNKKVSNIKGTVSKVKNVANEVPSTPKTFFQFATTNTRPMPTVGMDDKTGQKRLETELENIINSAKKDKRNVEIELAQLPKKENPTLKDSLVATKDAMFGMGAKSWYGLKETLASKAKDFSSNLNVVGAPLNSPLSSFSSTTAKMYGNYKVENKDRAKPQETWLDRFTTELKEGIQKADAKKISDAWGTAGEVRKRMGELKGTVSKTKNTISKAKNTVSKTEKVVSKVVTKKNSKQDKPSPSDNPRE